MTWIVYDIDKSGKVKMVSKSSVDGVLPIGSYLTIENSKTKFILRVDKSIENFQYAPEPLIIDMDLPAVVADQKSQNIVTAYRIKDLQDRADGLIDYILPQSQARKSNKEEINVALGSITEGPDVFLATVYAGQNQYIVDDSNTPITTKLPEDMFYHQILICGKTGSGKTVAAKYLAQYFVEQLEGSVLAVNVKETDLLRMDRPSETKNEACKKEWDVLKAAAHGIENYVVYYPPTLEQKMRGANLTAMTQVITLNVDEIDPDALSGLLYGMTDKAAMNLSSIFRNWRDGGLKKEGDGFNAFINYFNDHSEDKEFTTLNERGDESSIKLHHSTYDAVRRVLDSAQIFFDNQNAVTLKAEDILSKGKMSVINIDLSVKNSATFGSILLRDLLQKLRDYKNANEDATPLLIIIDEVHQFYDTDSSKEALGSLDTIARTGRSKKIGVMFISQDEDDIPSGLFNVINTKIFFRTDSKSIPWSEIGKETAEILKNGFAVSTIYGLPQLKILKFPLAYGGVFER